MVVVIVVTVVAMEVVVIFVVVVVVVVAAADLSFLDFKCSIAILHNAHFFIEIILSFYQLQYNVVVNQDKS